MKNTIKEILILVLLLVSPLVHAESETINVNLRTRIDLADNNGNWGISCPFLRLTIKGTIGDNLSYLFRQRLNKSITDGNFLNATDYLCFSWKQNKWTFNGGKYYLACGGFNYNSSTYNLHITPKFFEELGGMYNYLVNASYRYGKENFLFEISNSIYARSFTGLKGFSFNVSGTQGMWEHKYSVNLFEREKGKYNQFLCLGNRFHCGNVDIELDFDHRIDVRKPRMMEDFCIISKFELPLSKRVEFFGKVCWDYKGDVEDPLLPDNTNTWRAGGGFQFYPINEYKNLRLHCVYYNIDGLKNVLLLGIQWQLDIYSSKS